MSETKTEILTKERISIFAANRIITAQEFRNPKAESTQILQLSIAELLAAYDIWQQFYKEFGEPLVGQIVHTKADIGTEFDIHFDIHEAALDLGIVEDTETEEKLIASAADYVKANPEFTIESVPLTELAKLVCSVTVEHPKEEIEIEQERREWEALDPETLEPGEDVGFEDKLEGVLAKVTTIQAAAQLVIEAEEYGFHFKEVYGK